MDNKEEGNILNSEDSVETLKVHTLLEEVNKGENKGCHLGMISFPQKFVGNTWRHFCCCCHIGY